MSPIWMRLIYPVIGGLIGPWLFLRTESILPLVLFMLLIGVFFTRTILVMSFARWDALIRLEFDWFAFILTVAIAASMRGDAMLAEAVRSSAIWFCGGLIMFWVTFVARVIEK